jgi:hypothetical protein
MTDSDSPADSGRQAASREQSEPSAGRTGVEIYCEKPWSGLGASPKCTIRSTRSGGWTEHQLEWDATVFIPLEPGQYQMRIRRPSDFISFKATLPFAVDAGRVKKFVYESPAISIMAGTIRPAEEA